MTLKNKIFSSLGYELLGFLICLLVLFFLSGGKNFIKLYYDLQKLINVYDTVTSNYYGDLDKNKMIDKAIDSMLSQTKDNYTTYTTQKETNSFLETVDGTYEGIGCMVSMDQEGNIIVVSVFENGPAKKAGMKVVAISDDSSIKEREEIKLNADKFIKEYSELEDII